MSERTPLLSNFGRYDSGIGLDGNNDARQVDHHRDHHSQFCHLIGVRPINHPPDTAHQPHQDSLYRRALRLRAQQGRTYIFTATLINTLMLSQIVLGAALTGLGAFNQSGILIAVFGALNTIIAGAIAFLKSRGQPMRAKMFRDDLERVVDEIENSAVMWYGISNNLHGYDAIDTDEQVTVRGEVARLTRLYDKAVKNNSVNDPDMFSAGNTNTNGDGNDGLRKRSGPGALSQPAAPGVAAPPPDLKAGAGAGAAGGAGAGADAAAPAAPEAEDPDLSGPASQPPETAKPKDEEAPPTPAAKPEKADAAVPEPVASPPAPADDPDASPATAAKLPSKEGSQSSKTASETGKGGT